MPCPEEDDDHSCDLTPVEQVAFSSILGMFTAWMMIQVPSLASQWDTPTVVLEIVILAACVGIW